MSGESASAEQCAGCQPREAQALIEGPVRANTGQRADGEAAEAVEGEAT